MSIWNMFFGGGGGVRVSGSEAKQLVDDGAQLVDVRTPMEFAQGHLPGAINLPVGEIGRRADELDRGKTTVVYCRSGARSASAVMQLRSSGFDEVRDLGPITAW